jgi:hypothetical protein
MVRSPNGSIQAGAPDNDGRRWVRTAGLTLVEMLVATAASIIMLGLVAQLFASLSEAVRTDTTITQLDSQLRTVRAELFKDLDGYTVRSSQESDGIWTTNFAAANGYFEYIEGPNTDLCLFEDQANGFTAYVSPWFDKSGAQPGPTSASDDRIVGDTDDVLMLTTQAFGEPFVGRAAGQQIDSDYAEVAWFCLPTPGTSNPVTYTLFRRQLLVMGYVNAEPFASGQQQVPYTNWATYFDAYDVSVRRQFVSSANAYRLFVNSLQDLGKRENRMLHDTGDISAAGGKINRAALRSAPGTVAPAYPYYSRVGKSVDESVFNASSVRNGDDVVMTNVLAFDVKAFEAYSVFKVNGMITLRPHDRDYWSLATGGGVMWAQGLGSADLFYSRTIGTATPPPASSQYVSRNLSELYAVGKNTKLNRTDANGLVDDLFDTCPYDSSSENVLPEPHQYIAGLEITIRVFDPKTSRVRQITVVWSPQ